MVVECTFGHPSEMMQANQMERKEGDAAQRLRSTAALGETNLQLKIVAM